MMRCDSIRTRFLVAVVLAASAMPVAYAKEGKNRSIRVYEGQLSKARVESPGADNVVRVVNRAATDSDVDLVAVDRDGNMVDRHTVVVPPTETTSFRLGDAFPRLDFGAVSAVDVQASARPVQPDAKVEGYLAVAFFSQQDSRWSGNQLGGCSGKTIRLYGCAITSIAMAGARSVTNFNPASLNDYLTNNGGYANGGCDVIWSAPANIDGAGGFTYTGTGPYPYTINTPDNLRAIIDANQFAVVGSNRFGPNSHYVVVIGYDNAGQNLQDFVYLDPWDTSAQFRHVPDYGWVTTSSSVHKYQ